MISISCFNLILNAIMLNFQSYYRLLKLLGAIRSQLVALTINLGSHLALPQDWLSITYQCVCTINLGSHLALPQDSYRLHISVYVR